MVMTTASRTTAGTTTGSSRAHRRRPPFRTRTSPASLPGVCDNDTDDADNSYDEYYFGVLATELLPCQGAIENGEFDPEECHWFVTPDEPGARKAAAAPLARSAVAPFGLDCCCWATRRSCAGFADRP